MALISAEREKIAEVGAPYPVNEYITVKLVFTCDECGDCKEYRYGASSSVHQPQLGRFHVEGDEWVVKCPQLEHETRYHFSLVISKTPS